MTRFRFHIGTLVILILVLGVGLAAVREANETWDSSIFSITLGMLLISILLTVHRVEKRRAFWLGFALFGSAYLGLSLVPSIESRLITTKALAYLDSKVPGRSSGISSSQLLWNLLVLGSPSNSVQGVDVTTAGNQLAISDQGQVWLWNRTTGRLLGGWSGTSENFVKIGHSLFALLAGWLGGQLSRRLYRDSRHPEVSTPVESGESPR